jgi:short-subunit dehydrogenase
VGRNRERLEEVAALCRENGAEVSLLVCDVTDYDLYNQGVEDFDNKHPVDLLFANAGISGGTGDGHMLEPFEQTENIFKTNTLAAIHSAQLIYQKMCQRGRGQIAFTGSIAGFQGWGGAPSYSASKAALHIYAESLRMLAKVHNIKINIISPGFIKTSMTDQNAFPMPFMLSAKEAARCIDKGLCHNKRYIIFPKRMYILALLSHWLPESVLYYVSRSIRGKE